MIELKVPTLGESVTEATVGTWFKKAGDNVAVDEMICELETDKVTIEVPSTIDGVVSKIIVKEGETVELDAILAILEEGAAAAEKNKLSNDKTGEKNIAEETKSVKNAPSAEKIMKEKNIDPSSLKGSGRDGRIMKEDVMSLPNNQNTKKSLMPSMESEEKVKMTRLRQTIARRLKESQNTAAMLTTYNEADMTAILRIRNEFKDQFLSKHGVKLGFMSFFVKACCKALEEVPEVNAQIDGDYIIYKKYVNM
jgi:2-oxoglutarate dehydrogenase E2 component (dihydrolipoamide succinyltransferase)